MLSRKGSEKGSTEQRFEKGFTHIHTKKVHIRTSPPKLPGGEFLLLTGRPHFGSVRLRFGGGTVRVVPVFGSGGNSFSEKVPFSYNRVHNHFRPGTRPRGSVTGFTEKLFMCQMFMCLFLAPIQALASDFRFARFP